MAKKAEKVAESRGFDSLLRLMGIRLGIASGLAASLAIGGLVVAASQGGGDQPSQAQRLITVPQSTAAPVVKPTPVVPVTASARPKPPVPPHKASPKSTPRVTKKPVAKKPVVKKPVVKTDPRFSTCKAAKAAGYGPYTRGIDPEYYWYRDANSNGVVCE